ncbi:uncharacterized protein V1513DRAFT_431070 [Lipomyces chichibuensis]|uniref:uncharacterized protein n=1 Tax=Lipomyces chichibuensis TaxID=1546026 RepID=UPI0033433C34
MAHSELLAAVRRPLSPDSQTEIPASREEYEYVQQILEEEDVKYPRLQYDGPPSWKYGGELTTSILEAVGNLPGLDSSIKGRLRSASEMSNTRDTGGKLTTGALRYRGVTYRSLRAAISFSVCALHCRIGITMCINEGDRGTRAPIQYYSTAQERDTAVQQAGHRLRIELRNNPYGPLISNGFTWYGSVRRVVVEAFCKEDDECPPDTLLEPKQSFAFVEHGQFVGGAVPSNLAQLRLKDCIPSHVLCGNACKFL